MRKIIPHALLAVLTLGAGLGALTSFQSTRFSAARAALIAAPCIGESNESPIPGGGPSIEAIVPANAVSNAGLYAMPKELKLIAVAPTGWVCHALNFGGVDIRNTEDQTKPLSVIQFLTNTGPDAQKLACPFSKEAENEVLSVGGEPLVKSPCVMSKEVSITNREGAYVYITVKLPNYSPQYGVIAYSKVSDTTNVGICVPSDTLTPGQPSYVFDRSVCQQYLRAFARNNPLK
ncbi:unannotated protein [freshwater metagenome]|uniref:Unannotated protein n=1 Tax=freshwater metagenome TaxID=449393 RepID=A0A6J7E8A0_9ZZZZ|nr:hypothetical protein [Actinomycetota bacterium]